MNRIADLITDLCPRGVAFKPLGDIGTIFGGLTGKSKADFTNGNARFVSYLNVYNNMAVDVGADDFVGVNVGERQRMLRRGDILFTGSSETADEVGMSSVVTSDVSEPLYLNSFCIGFRLNDPHTLIPDFAKYLFRSGGMRRKIVRTASGVTRFNVSKARLAQVKIPVPPPEIQLEIARVLGTFTELEADLEADLAAELEARWRQYKYYRDALLNFTGADAGRQAKIRTLGEIGSFIRGTGIQKSDFTETGVGCIHYGQIHTHYGTWANETRSFISSEFAARLRKASNGDLVIATTSEDDEAVAKAVAWLGDEDVAVSTDAYIFQHTLNPRYVSYFFQTELFRSQKKPHITGTKVRRISGESLAKIRIPVPTREEQDRVVAILDKLYALVNDLSSGLRGEIKARRQQYAYYRDSLLTFREAP